MTALMKSIRPIPTATVIRPPNFCLRGYCPSLARTLVNLAFRFCRDRSRAEEMAQEAFLRACRSLHRWRREAAFSTWLFALATNLYCSECRRIPARTFSLDDGRGANGPPELSMEALSAKTGNVSCGARFSLFRRNIGRPCFSFTFTTWTWPPRRGASPYRRER
jgi:Sigma-70 region 2